MDAGSTPPTVMQAVGAQADVCRAVTDADTASSVGSGELPVLATPRMIALMEAAACLALAGHLPPGATSVGSAVDIRHLAPSPIGAAVIASATVTGFEGEKVTFDLTARHVVGDGRAVMIGRGTHSRVIVDRGMFMDSVSG